MKNTATACSERKAKQENKVASYSTYCIVHDLIDFLVDDLKEIKTPTEKRNIHNCENIVLTKSWFVFSNFENFGKIMFWPSVFTTKNHN